MTTRKSSFDSVKKTAEKMTEDRIKKFVDSLNGNLTRVNGKLQSLQGREYPATNIDNWLRRAASDGLIEGISLNRAAFEVWKALDEAGATITGQDRCLIVPDPEIEKKLVRAIEKKFTKE